ncbi:TPA: nucleotidyltransferase domain-containing protein [Candidatus Scatousia excrementigallinarum]|uniref:Nucleotidyltransferase domain-containing protein n=1 Tax=Candidatus Scatousia excrementigallinarum TaxID=2840935 RepID=A0A9D1EZI2_9BACT|nr:nucleotidyltransferase domain-containing protein [Candidatus Scatousia excrementigallinarum]
MDFDINLWLKNITFRLKDIFKERVIFIGYHGSFKRGEAGADSDIDLVVILDKLDLYDLINYKKLINSMPFAEKACGFISGKREIENWSKTDLFQFAFETEALYGDIKDIISMPDKDDIVIYVKTAAESLYHALCHSFLYDKNPSESLSDLYKMSFFILQADYYVKKGKYIPTKRELLNLLDGDEKVILTHCINKDKIHELNDSGIDSLYELLLNWCSHKIIKN